MMIRLRISLQKLTSYLQAEFCRAKNKSSSKRLFLKAEGFEQF